MLVKVVSHINENLNAPQNVLTSNSGVFLAVKHTSFKLE